MKYTSLHTAEPIVHKDYSKKIIFHPEDFPTQGHLLQVVTIPPKTNQRVHLHMKQTEVFYILKGSAELTFNESTYTVSAGDAFICEPNDKHNFNNTSRSPIEILVFKINFEKNTNDTTWST